MPIKEIAYYLIDYWNALYNIYPECFTDAKEYFLLQKPGMPSMNKLFLDVYWITLQDGEVSEFSIYNILTRLLVETNNHPVPEFRFSIDPEFWSYESGPVYGIISTRQNIQNLYDNLQEKIWLAGR